jgi:hypothetical protein
MKRTILIYLVTIISSLAYGQTEKLLNPADLKQQTVITEPLTLRKGYWRIGVAYTYGAIDKIFDNSTKKVYATESSWGSSSSFQLWTIYGITDRLSVELDLNFEDYLLNLHHVYYVPEIDTMVVSNTSVKGRGFGDLYASIAYQIIPSEGHKFSLKASANITIPTGRKNPKNVVSASEFDYPTGTGEFAIEPKIWARYLSYPFSIDGYVGYSYYFRGSKIMNPTDTEEMKFKSGNCLSTGGMISIHLNEWIALINEVSYQYIGKGELEGVSPSDRYIKWKVVYLPKLIFQIRRFRIGEVVSIPLKGKMLAADPGYGLIASYIF